MVRRGSGGKTRAIKGILRNSLAQSLQNAPISFFLCFLRLSPFSAPPQVHAPRGPEGTVFGSVGKILSPSCSRKLTFRTKRAASGEKGDFSVSYIKRDATNRKRRGSPRTVSLDFCTILDASSSTPPRASSRVTWRTRRAGNRNHHRKRGDEAPDILNVTR